MKARVKATGEIVELHIYDTFGEEYLLEEIELDDADYRTRLKHKYAGMAMQGLLLRGAPDSLEHLAEYCHRVANILVEEVMR